MNSACVASSDANRKELGLVVVSEEKAACRTSEKSGSASNIDLLKCIIAVWVTELSVL